MNFLKPALFSFDNDYCMHQVAWLFATIVKLLLERPLTHYWTSPLNAHGCGSILNVMCEYVSAFVFMLPVMCLHLFDLIVHEVR